jgi:three-Cys-motif partner protein
MTNKEFKKLKDDLWLAANKMRADSDLKSTDYAPQVLGIIFLKFADIKYSKYEDEIQQEFKKKIGSRLEDTLDKIAIEKCGLYLPAKSRYNYLVGLSTDKEIDKPKSFDKYIFVEKIKKNAFELKKNTSDEHPEKDILIVQGDCNIELKKVARILQGQKGKKYRVLAYIDPCGMELEWSSIAALKDVKIDIWILVPTGLGVNRLLTKSGEITTKWLERLEKFLGLSIDQIKEYFYKERKELTLFGEETYNEKEKNAIDKSATLYKKRLKEVFEFVTDPYVLKNKTGTPMYHLFMAANNNTGVKIANDIIRKYSKMN